MNSNKESAFVKALGSTPWAKILDHLIVFREHDHTKTRVAEKTGLSRVTTHKIWEKMVKMGIIVETRTIGKGNYHRLNTKNPVTRAIFQMFSRISPEHPRENKQPESLPKGYH